MLSEKVRDIRVSKAELLHLCKEDALQRRLLLSSDSKGCAVL